MVDEPPYTTTAQDADTWLRIVGVIADKRDDGLRNPILPEIFVPYTLSMRVWTQILIRSDVPPLSLLHAIGTQVTPSTRPAGQWTGRRSRTLDHRPAGNTSKSNSSRGSSAPSLCSPWLSPPSDSTASFRIRSRNAPTNSASASLWALDAWHVLQTSSRPRRQRGQWNPRRRPAGPGTQQSPGALAEGQCRRPLHPARCHTPAEPGRRPRLRRPGAPCRQRSSHDCPPEPSRNSDVARPPPPRTSPVQESSSYEIEVVGLASAAPLNHRFLHRSTSPISAH